VYVTYREVLAVRHSTVKFTGDAIVATWDNRTIPVATDDRKGKGEFPLMIMNVLFAGEETGTNNH
jgi:hypothetical protein